MATIVTRAGKGSALTFTEGDANFTNLNNDKLENINSESIGDLIDVTVTTPSTNQILQYSAGGQWENQDLPAGVSSLADLTDVDNSLTPTDGQILVWNNSLSQFEAQTPASGGIANVVEDTTPQLGGNLDCQQYSLQNPTLEDYAETVHSLGSTDTPTLTVSNGNVQTVTITSGLTIPAFSDAATGQSMTLIVTGSGTASGTANHKFAGGNTTLTSFSVVSIFYDGTTYWTSIATDFQ